MIDPVDPGAISFIGNGLQRPECVLATRSGELFVSDARGGVSIFGADGAQRLARARGVPDGFLPNGIALMANRDLMIANLGADGGVWRMRPDGEARLHLAEVDGVALPPVNFVGIDRQERLWITISTRQVPREKAMQKGWADGFIVMEDATGARIVADNIGYTNEAIVDPTGAWLYVNETIGRRTIRFPIRPDGSLGERDVVAAYPPATFPDGFAFDAEGGVWCVSVATNRVIHVARDGTQTIVVEDADQETVAEAAAAFEAGPLPREIIDAGKRRRLGNIASIAFGGADLRTIYMGSLFGDGIATFRSPVAGAPPVHWDW